MNDFSYDCLAFMNWAQIRNKVCKSTKIESLNNKKKSLSPAPTFYCQMREREQQLKCSFSSFTGGSSGSSKVWWNSRDAFSHILLSHHVVMVVPVYDVSGGQEFFLDWRWWRTDGLDFGLKQVRHIKDLQKRKQKKVRMKLIVATRCKFSKRKS